MLVSCGDLGFAGLNDLIQQDHPQTDQPNGRLVGTVHQRQHIVLQMILGGRNGWGVNRLILT